MKIPTVSEAQKLKKMDQIIKHLLKYPPNSIYKKAKLILTNCLNKPNITFKVLSPLDKTQI